MLACRSLNSWAPGTDAPHIRDNSCELRKPFVCATHGPTDPQRGWQPDRWCKCNVPDPSLLACFLRAKKQDETRAKSIPRTLPSMPLPAAQGVFGLSSVQPRPSGSSDLCPLVERRAAAHRGGAVFRGLRPLGTSGCQLPIGRMHGLLRCARRWWATNALRDNRRRSAGWASPCTHSPWAEPN